MYSELAGGVVESEVPRVDKVVDSHDDNRGGVFVDSGPRVRKSPADFHSVMTIIDSVQRSRSPPFTIGNGASEWKTESESGDAPGPVSVKSLEELHGRVSGVERGLAQLTEAMKMLTAAVARAHGTGGESTGASSSTGQSPPQKSQGAFNRILAMQQGGVGHRGGPTSSLLDVARAALRAKRDAESGRGGHVGVPPLVIRGAQAEASGVGGSGASDVKEGSPDPPRVKRGLARFRQAGLRVMKELEARAGERRSYLHDTDVGSVDVRYGSRAIGGGHVEGGSTTAI
jgi:hypothetical protein